MVMKSGAQGATSGPEIVSVIAGANGLTVNGPGSNIDGSTGTGHGYFLILAGLNTYTGTTTIDNGGAIRVTQSGSTGLALNALLNNASGGVILNNGGLQSTTTTIFAFKNGLNATAGQAGNGQISLSGSLADFSGRSSVISVVIGTANSVLVWGSSGVGAATGNFNPGILGLQTGDQTGGSAEGVVFSNGLDLNGATRTIELGSTNTGASQTGTITAVISSARVGEVCSIQQTPMEPMPGR